MSSIGRCQLFIVTPNVDVKKTSTVSLIINQQETKFSGLIQQFFCLFERCQSDIAKGLFIKIKGCLAVTYNL